MKSFYAFWGRGFCLFALFFVTLPLCAGDELYKQFQPAESNRQPEEIEWTITYSMNCRDTSLPRLLLIGDSIVYNYQKPVQDSLSDKMNVTFWSTSKCVTDPDYFRELNLILNPRPYDVISFNNGLHSFDTDLEPWKAAYRAAVKFIRAKCPDAKILITLATPVSESWKTDKVKEMNDFAQSVAREENLTVVDLFEPMTKFAPEDCWNDGIHFKDDPILIQREIVSKAALRAVGSAE